MTASALAAPDRPGRRWPLITTLGLTQILAWGSSYYLPAVLAAPIAADTGWPPAWIVGGLSLGLLTAGLVSPVVGRMIATRGGRPVLMASAVLLCGGLLVLGLSPTLPFFLAGWIAMGLGMGCGLYDPAFATLGRLYGEGGRAAITALTLFGGFASTVCWPLSAVLEAHLGWRGACLTYAVIQLAISLPLYLFGLPREPRSVAALANKAVGAPDAAPVRPPPALALPLIALSLTAASVLSTIFSVHLLTMLQAKGLGLAEAVTLGALVGPSQVGARAIEMLIARHHHPIWTKLASVMLVALGLAALLSGGPVIRLAIVLYGAGVGLESIARGTLPLAVFGVAHYPVIMGRIAMPNLFVQAAAPAIGVALLASAGLNGALAAFTALALGNVAVASVLLLVLRRS